MGKDDENNREPNRNPTTNKKKGKDANSKQIVGSKSGKSDSTTSTVSVHTKSHTSSTPKESESVFRMEKNIEILADNMVKLTSEVSKLKSNQEQPQTVQWNEQYEEPSGDYFSDQPCSGFYQNQDAMFGESHADESEYSRDFYDADRPLIDFSRDKSGTADSCTDMTDEVKDNDNCTIQFDDVLSEYNTVEEKTCSSVNQKLADGVNVMFKKGMQLEKYKDKIGQIDRPENCTGLTNVEVEEIIWNLLQPQTKNFDKRLQIIQNAMAKSACCITQMLDVIQKQCIDKTTAESDIVKLKTELARLGTSSLALLGHAFHNLCLRRRELQKPDVAWKYGNIFIADVEHTRWLHGGKAQVEEMIKDIGTTNKVAREMKPNFKYHNRGSYGYSSRFTPYPKPAAGSMRQRGPFGRGNGGQNGRPGRFMNFGRGGGRAGNHPSRGSVRSKVKTAPYFSRGEVSSKTKLSLYNHNNVNAMKSESIPFQAGRIRHYLENWQNITSDHEILQTVSGATIEFANGSTESEVQFTQAISKFNAMQTEIVQNEIMDLQSKQFIEEVEHE